MTPNPRYSNYVSTIVPGLYYGDVTFQVQSWLASGKRKVGDTVPINANCSKTVWNTFAKNGWHVSITPYFYKPGHFVARLVRER